MHMELCILTAAHPQYIHGLSWSSSPHFGNPCTKMCCNREPCLVVRPPTMRSNFMLFSSQRSTEQFLSSTAGCSCLFFRPCLVGKQTNKPKNITAYENPWKLLHVLNCDWLDSEIKWTKLTEHSKHFLLCTSAFSVPKHLVLTFTHTLTVTLWSDF